MNTNALLDIRRFIDTTSSPAHIVAITKTHPFEVIREAYAEGLLHIGENRIQEAEEKIVKAKELGLDGIIWHMVGHVQSRKASDVARLFDWIDSADRMKTIRLLDKKAGEIKKQLHILLEVNLSGETTKYGFDMTDWEHHSEKLKHFHLSIHESMKLQHVIMEGLMTMPPLVTNAEDNRAIFQSMSRLSEAIQTQIPAFGRHLSMGTSSDYQVAIQEGATQVRLGEALFGKRTA